MIFLNNVNKANILILKHQVIYLGLQVAIKELKNLIIQVDLLIAYDISFRIFSLNKKEVLDEVKMQKDLDL